MAEAIVSFVAEKLGDLILQEGKFLLGVGDQVRDAQVELRMIKCFLKDADAKQRDQKVICGFVAEIREAAYDLEDVVETFAFKVASKRKGGFKNLVKRFGCIFNEGVDLHKVGSEIGGITTRIAKLRSSLQSYNIQEISQSGGATSSQLHERKQQLRRTYSHVIDHDVVGLENSTKQLVMHLVEDEYRHRVVSIWGMGGLGKSTLAKKVYHHDDVRRRFSCFAWVCVSQQFQVRTVWQDILVKLSSPTKEEKEDIARMNDDEIAKKIYQVQQDKKCLVVIDDIWTTEAWDSLKAAFPYEQEKNKILLTTRRKVVAEHADPRGFLYQPQPLTEIESWELFEKTALLPRAGEIDLEIYHKLKDLAKEMLERCAGLPLAINVLAGLLAKKHTVHEWDAVHKNLDANIMRGVGQGEEYAGVSWLLELSYDDLPYHLKPCFLYLGLFPEDSEISASGLTKQWMAEGFISSSNVNSMEDSAYDCLDHLVERCMVQVGKPGLQVRKIKTCRIHDLMWDMCLRKAEEENFLQIANFSNRHSSVGKVRRLAIHLEEKNEKSVPSRDERDGHMRTLLYFCTNYYDWMPEQVKSLRSMLEDFQLLRILKFDNMGLRGDYLKLPEAVGSMVHLRFLSLSGSWIRHVPSSIGNLINLQTLDLRAYCKDKVILDVFWKMEQLRHLYFPWSSYTSKRKLKLSTLHNLQTLSRIRSDCCNFGDLAELKNLTKLDVEFEGEGPPSSTDLGQLLQCTSSNCIRSLTVRDTRSDNSATVVQIILSCRDTICALDLFCVEIRELATGLQNYHNLTKLTVVHSDLKYDQMAMLEQVPNLITLTLNSAFKSDSETPNSETLHCSKGGFRRLQSLFLCDPNLKKWTVSEGAMPSLCRLTISYCGSLKEIPIGLRYSTALKELIIDMMPRRFCSRLEEGGDDFCTIQQVPSVVIRYVHEDEDET